jgi:hypothetical protein
MILNVLHTKFSSTLGQNFYPDDPEIYNLVW